MKGQRTLADLGAAMRAKVVARENGCHEWQGAKGPNGYGMVRFNGRNVRAHRAALAVALNRVDLIEAPITPSAVSQYALHSCDNRSCVNPSHLRLGSPLENSNDVDLRDRRNPLDFNPNIPRKLSPEAVMEIREVAVTWEGLCDMMKKHKVGQLAINDVLRRKTYKHVEDCKRIPTLADSDGDDGA